MTLLDRAKAKEEAAQALREANQLPSIERFVDAACLYASAAMVHGPDPQAWEGAERCARAAAAGLDRVADYFSQQRELVRSAH